MRDPAQFVPPMLAVTAPAPFDNPDWWFEVKWDGFRVEVSVVERVRVYSRSGRDLLPQFPELAEVGEQVQGPVVLDGELLTVDRASGAVQPFPPRREAGATAVVVVFDCLYDREGWLIDQPWLARRRHLTAAVATGGRLIVAEGVPGQGRAYFRAAVARGLEGVVAKRLDSRYRPGHRSAAWRKVVAVQVIRLAIQAVEYDRSGRPWWQLGERGGALLARVPAPAGWSAADGLPEWAEVAYRNYTPAGRLRHARLRTYHGDRSTGDCN